MLPTGSQQEKQEAAGDSQLHATSLSPELASPGCACHVAGTWLLLLQDARALLHLEAEAGGKDRFRGRQ